jgi:hypothetical protein
MKYKVIVKIDKEKFIKYHTTNLVSFCNFLDVKFPSWRYVNVFNDNREQIANYTKNNRPI